jgi:hypothetical protein
MRHNLDIDSSCYGRRT